MRKDIQYKIGTKKIKMIETNFMFTTFSARGQDTIFSKKEKHAYGSTYES